MTPETPLDPSGVENENFLPRSSFSRRCRRLHRPRSESRRWGKPGNAPSPPAAAACSPERREEEQRMGENITEEPASSDEYFSLRQEVHQKPAQEGESVKAAKQRFRSLTTNYQRPDLSFTTSLLDNSHSGLCFCWWSYIKVEWRRASVDSTGGVNQRRHRHQAVTVPLCLILCLLASWLITSGATGSGVYIN